MKNKSTPFVIQSLWVLFVIFSFNQPLLAQLPTGFKDTKLQSGYQNPMGVAFSKDGKRMFVWEKKGTLWVSTWNGTAYVKQNSAALNIQEEVGDWSELGLESVALDPNFDINGLIYLFYQVDRHHLLNFGTPQYDKNADSYGAASISRVTRYKLINTNSVYTTDAASRKVLLGETKSTGVPLLHESHAGGQIIFGTDGTLLVSTGDNGTSGGTDLGSNSGTYYAQALADGILRPQENVGTLRAQMLNSLCGKILRLDPKTGDGVPSNPHYDATSPRSAKSRVWAMGLRNPYRMALKTDTGSPNADAGNPGTLLVADVQWFSQEELNVIEKGGLNCGWPLFEGLEKTTNYYDESANVKNQDETGKPSFQSLCVQTAALAVNTDIKKRRFTHFSPALDWKHSQDITRYPDFGSGSLVPKTLGSPNALVLGKPFSGICGTSGTYYSGTKFPTNFQNVFFFADYGFNWMKAALIQDNSSFRQIREVKEFAPVDYGKGIVDIEYCPLDESIVYINFSTAEIHKISYEQTNLPPVAVISVDKTSGASPLTINFSSIGSSDPNGNPITYLWDFGDNTTATTANPSHTFTSPTPKDFKVSLTVKDNGGLTDTKSIQISIILNNPIPATTAFNANKCYRLTARHSNKVMEIEADSKENNIKIQQGVWKNTPSQVWRFKSVDRTYYRIINGFSGLVMDVKGGTKADGAAIIQYQDAPIDYDNQRWRFDKNTDGYYTIAAKHSGKMADVFNANTNAGTKIIQYIKNGGTNQQWTVAETTCPTGTVALLASQIFTADSYRDGNNGIITWVSNASDADYFTLEKLNKQGDFETLDNINAKPINGINGQNYYAYTDNLLNDGENTYRIALITDNGPPQYSRLITLNFKIMPDFTLSPNPTNDYVELDLTPFKDRNITLTVIDALGRQVRTITVEKADKIQRIQLEGLTNGQYMLHIHTSGKRDVTRVFTINRF
jgi:glucose/arabinose dehydrogenase/PKD repeat protein